jgi:hypothetical protein
LGTFRFYREVHGVGTWMPRLVYRLERVVNKGQEGTCVVGYELVITMTELENAMYWRNIVAHRLRVARKTFAAYYRSSGEDEGKHVGI